MLEVKFKCKLIDIDKIDMSCVESTQARVNDADSRDVQILQESIEQVGLQDPISVEVKNYDEVNPEYSEYIIRDGNHRLKSFENLKNKHKNSQKYDKIKCVVYEKNTAPNADYEWLEWQIHANRHLEKTHKKATERDTVSAAYKLLISGYICEEAKKQIDKDNWKHKSIENALNKWLKGYNNFNKARLDKLVTQIFAEGKQIFNAKIKKYEKSDLKKILLSEFEVESSGGTNEPGTVRAYAATNQDIWTKIAATMIKICQAGKKDAENHIIFHSKSNNVDQIDQQRKRFSELVDEVNDFYKKNVKGFKQTKVIDGFHILGQKVRRGEEANKLI